MALAFPSGLITVGVFVGKDTYADCRAALWINYAPLCFIEEAIDGLFSGLVGGVGLFIVVKVAFTAVAMTPVTA